MATQQIETFKTNDIELINYQKSNAYEIINNNSVICINSIIKLEKFKPEYFKNTIVYIDEINSLLGALTHNDALNGNIKTICNVLFNIISSCNKIIEVMQPLIIMY